MKEEKKTPPRIGEHAYAKDTKRRRIIECVLF
jgi:hypothetical protein